VLCNRCYTTPDTPRLPVSGASLLLAHVSAFTRRAQHPIAHLPLFGVMKQVLHNTGHHEAAHQRRFVDMARFCPRPRATPDRTLAPVRCYETGVTEHRTSRSRPPTAFRPCWRATEFPPPLTTPNRTLVQVCDWTVPTKIENATRVVASITSRFQDPASQLPVLQTRPSTGGYGDEIFRFEFGMAAKPIAELINSAIIFSATEQSSRGLEGESCHARGAM